MPDQIYRWRIKRGDVEFEVEGDKEFVEKHVEEFKKEIPAIAKESVPTEKIITSETSKEKGRLSGLSLAEFYKQKKPKGDIEVAITIAYYLTRSREKEEFANLEIKQEAKKLGYTLSNPAYTLKEAAKGKKAYVNKIGKGIWELTSEGKKLVEEELPRKTEG